MSDAVPEQQAARAESKQPERQKLPTTTPEAAGGSSLAFSPSLGATPLPDPSSLTQHRATLQRLPSPALRQQYTRSLARQHGNTYLQRVLAPASPASSPAPDLASQIDAQRGGGQPLDPATRAGLEPTLGADLGGVRVHTGPAADQVSQAVQAEAFTTGQDIFFRSGRYDPGSQGGQALLAHEATHTVQQARGPVTGQDWGGGVAVSDPNDSFEQEAEATARHAVQRLATESAVGDANSDRPPAGGSTTSDGTIAQRAIAGTPALATSEITRPDGGPRTSTGDGRGGLATVQRAIATPASQAEAAASDERGTASGDGAGEQGDGPRVSLSLPSLQRQPLPSLTRDKHEQTNQTTPTTGPGAAPLPATGAGPAGEQANAMGPVAPPLPAPSSGPTGPAGPGAPPLPTMSHGPAGSVAPSQPAAPGAPPMPSSPSAGNGLAGPQNNEAANQNTAPSGPATTQEPSTGERAAPTQPAAPGPAGQPPAASSTPPGAPPTPAGAPGGPATGGGTTPPAAPGLTAPSKASGGQGGTPGPAGDQAGQEASASEVKTTSDTSVNKARLQSTLKRVGGAATAAKTHEPTDQKVGEAQGAAVPPANDLQSRAEAGQVNTMAAAPTGKPQPKTFLDMLRAKIAELMPKDLDEADKFKDSGKATQMKGAVAGGVTQQKDQAAGGIKAATEATPNAAGQPAKPVTPLPPAAPGAPPPAVNAAGAIPPPKPEAAVSAEASKQDADKAMADNKLDDEQMKKANDPRFSAVTDAKKEVHQTADQTPQQYRQQEQATLNQAKGEVKTAEGGALQGMQQDKAQAAAAVLGKQTGAKSKDEQARKEIADKIQAVFGKTKKAVEDKLSSLDKEVGDLFNGGEKAARDKLVETIDSRMTRWKLERYLARPGGLALWAYDQFNDLNDYPEVKAIFDQARQQYLTDMDATLVKIADTVEARLKEAKDLIAQGRAEVQEIVNSQPANLRKVAEEAANNVNNDFKGLEQNVEDKRQDLANTIAERYKSAVEEMDKTLEEKKAENRGLVNALKDKIKAVVEILEAFKARLVGMVADAQAVVDKIVKDPIKFLGHLLDAVKLGFQQFGNNIWAHLKKGLMGWLFGTLVEAGIQLPDKFDLAGIIRLVMQILGLTFDRVRGIAVQIIGERNVKAIEKVAQMIQTLVTGGLGALWDWIKDQLSNLKEVVLDAIKDWVVTKIVQAAIQKLATMWNPVGAIIEAIMGIYNFITFLFERAQQIMTLIEAVIKSVGAIADGNIQNAANWIENALAKAIPVVLGFLANMIGLGGISSKIREIIGKVQDTVTKAIKWGITKIWNGLKKVAGFVTGLFGGGKKATPDDGKKAKEELKDGEATEADHPQLAAAAVAELSEGEVESEDYTEVRQQTEAKARQIEETYTRKLKPGIKLSVKFADATKDEEDEELDFDVVIAPNDTKKPGKRKLSAGMVRLRKAISDGGGIVGFMHKLSTTGAINKYTLDQFKKDWAKQDLKDYLKDQFRAADKYTHEWVPSNMILSVIERSRDATNFTEGADWIDLMHELRSDNTWIIFRPSYAKTAVYKRKTYSVPQGHVTAIYLDGISQHTHQGSFHNACRAAFTGASSIKEVIKSLEDVLEKYVWGGAESFSHPPHPLLHTHENLDIAANFASFSATQAKNFASIQDKFESHK